MTHEFAIPRLRSSATVKELDCVSFWSGLEYFESLAHLRISSPQSFVPYQHLLSCDNELPVAYFVYATYCKLVIFACYSTHMRLLREFSFYEFERKTTRGRILECLFSPNSQKPILCCTFSTGEVLLLDLSQRAISFTVQQIHFQFQLENPLCCWLDDANFVLSTDSTFYGCNINQKLFSVHHASNRISCFQMFRQDSHYLGKQKIASNIAFIP